MSKYRRLFGLVFLLLFAGSCKKEEIKHIEEIGYGTSFGMCIDYCNQELLISGNKLTFSKSKNGTDPAIKICVDTIGLATTTALGALIKEAGITTLPKIIGCPDCADGGAEWVSVKADGKLYKVTFEYGKAPAMLQPLVARLKALSGSFKNCN